MTARAGAALTMVLLPMMVMVLLAVAMMLAAIRMMMCMAVLVPTQKPAARGVDREPEDGDRDRLAEADRHG